MIKYRPELRPRWKRDEKERVNRYLIEVFDANRDRYDFTQYTFMEKYVYDGFTSLSISVRSDSCGLDKDYPLFRQYLKEFVDSLSLDHVNQIWLKIVLNYDYNLLLPLIFEMVKEIKLCKLELHIPVYSKENRNDVNIPQNISLFNHLETFHLIVARDHGLTKGGTLHLSHEFYDLNLDFFYFEYYEEDRGQSEFDGFYRLICKEEDLKKIKKTEFVGLRKKFI